jgi:hypothetical protein
LSKNRTMNYDAIKSRVLSAKKAKDHVLFTGTALIPGEPDCDFEDGEEILTAEKVARIAHKFMNYRIIDKEHDFLVTKKNMGDPVESYLLDEPKVMKNIHGEEREYPAGTWVVKSKITDPEMMEAALKGEIAYSVSVLSEDDADKITASMKGRVLIKDINNPVGFTVSLTRTPCVDNSCSVKSANKAGRPISKENKSILEKARDLIDSLINTESPGTNNGGDNMTEKNKNDEKKEYVEKSDVEDIVKKAVKEAIKDEKEELASKSDPDKCPNCEIVVKSTDKFCSGCGTKIGKEETDKKGGVSKSIKTSGNNKPTPAVKSFEEELGRDLYGCKL